MKRLILCFTAGVTLLTACSKDEPEASWQKLTAFPGNTKHFATAVYNDDAYLFFGEITNLTYSPAVWKYSSENDKWVELPEFDGAARSKSTAFSAGGKIVIVGGEIVTVGSKKEKIDNVLQYDPSNNSWATLNTFPGGATCAGMTFEVNNEIYYGLGQYEPESEYSRSFWKYKPATDEWIRLADYPGALPASYDNLNYFSILYSRFTRFVVEDRIFLVTGEKFDEPEMWEYASGSNEWTEITDLTFEDELAQQLFLVRGGGGCYTHMNKCYLFLGARLNDLTIGNLFHEFDPVTHQWSIKRDVQSLPSEIPSVAFIIKTDKAVVFGSDYNDGTVVKGYQLWRFNL